MLFNCRKNCGLCEIDCDLFSILEEIIDALDSVSEESIIEICFRKDRSASYVVARLRPFSDESPEFVGMGKTYREATFSLIKSLQKYANKMSRFPPPNKS